MSSKSTFSFIHAADIHLDSPLRGLAGQESETAESIRLAPRRAFENLVSQAIEADVAFVVIAGDLYDGNWRDHGTGLFFASQMGRLRQSSIPAFLLYGNHDAESQITKRLSLPENVHVFSSKTASTLILDDVKVALHGRSFPKSAVTENLVPSYPDARAGHFNIGVLHTALAGTEGHEPYAPCAPADLINKGYDYWALGHVHAHQIVNESPHILFPGNLQGRHAREIGPKGAMIVSVEDGDVVEIQRLLVDVVRWAVLSIDVSPFESIPQVYDVFRTSIEDAVSRDSDGRLLACRIVLTGESDFHGELTSSTTQLRAEAQAAAAALGDGVAWVEKVQLNTQPTLSAEALAAREDALGELQTYLADAAEDTEFVRSIESEIQDLVRKLPNDIRQRVEDGILKSAIAGDYASLIEVASREVVPRLIGST